MFYIFATTPENKKPPKILVVDIFFNNENILNNDFEMIGGNSHTIVINIII